MSLKVPRQGPARKRGEAMKRQLVDKIEESRDPEGLSTLELDQPRRKYTMGEDRAILTYIWNKIKRSKKVDQIHLSGICFWEKLVDKGILERPWSSVRNRFLKHILPKLYRYSLVVEKAKKILEVGGVQEEESKRILRKLKQRNSEA